MSKTILVTGGCGFVGSNLAVQLKKHFDDVDIVALDNLRRRGSELNISRLHNSGVQFVHGDIRNKEDLKGIRNLDTIIECSAEPSVLAGYGGCPMETVNTNFIGTLNCLELARETRAGFIFMSTNRIYPYDVLNQIKFYKPTENTTRFLFDDCYTCIRGVGCAGVNESFTTTGLRSLYGTTKFCSEQFVQEFGSMYGFRTVINRCGVIAGPWQMGKCDQGIIAFWIWSHLRNLPVTYHGYGGWGFQVRDILHISDLSNLIIKQVERINDISGQVFNVGGGPKNATSLKELTALCQKYTGETVNVFCGSETRVADIPWYITDNSKVMRMLDWEPTSSVEATVADIAKWMKEQEYTLAPILGIGA